jgi:hypothetical protein
MRCRTGALACALAVSLLVGGCRGDGPLPAIDEETSNRLSDVARDLANVAAGDPQARQDLAEDLAVFTNDNPEARTTVQELAGQIADLVAGRAVTGEQARLLAEDLWKAAAATELSSRQVEVLRTDVQTHLTAIGVAEDRAAEVAAQVGTLQEQVTRPRRWYEFF